MITTRLARIGRIPAAAFALLFCTACDAAAQCPDPVVITRGVAPPLATVRYLADDALEGRLAGTEGERCAAEYIAGQFKALGLRPGAGTSYFQEIPLASAINPHAPSGTGRNVIGTLEGSNPRLRDEWIIIGAHYDHLGRGEFSSTAPNAKNAIHNGADDNASGVAVVIDAARRLVRARPERSVAFIAFSGEESGLLGSRFFAAHPTIDLTRARAMLNLDMVGRLATGQLIIYGTATAKEWDAILAKAAAAERLSFKAQPEGTGPSDHTSFYEKDIPVLHFFTNVHGQYHNPDDDWDRIDAAGLSKVGSLVARIAGEVAGSTPSITLVRGMGRPAQPVGAPRGSGTYLGTVPDFSPVERGVLLSGVTGGSPADKAGIKAKDVIIRFDDEGIADLQGMTDALRKRKPGDVVRVTVLRDGKEVTLTATLGSR